MRRDGDVTYRCFQRLSRAGNEVACLSQYFSTRRSSRQLNHLHNVIVLSCRLSSSINWSGERPIRLDDGRYFVVVGALCQGRYALFDTESLQVLGKCGTYGKLLVQEYLARADRHTHYSLLHDCFGQRCKVHFPMVSQTTFGVLRPTC